MTFQLSRFLLTAILFGASVSAFSTTAMAERPKEPIEKATHIVTGTVRKVFRRNADANLEYVIQLRIESVQKGTGVEAGDYLYAYAFQRKRGAPLEPSASGHNAIPAEGHRIEVALVARQGRMEGLYPDWFTPLKEPAPAE